MNASLVLTVIGPDRPGLVEALAATVAQHGGNWEQSRMAHLFGQFAGILKVSVPADQVETLRRALEQLDSRGLRVVSETVGGHQPAEFRPFHLEVVGNDRAGIVREIARALAARGVNVEELDSNCESAPMAGSLMFHATALLRVPDGVEIAELRETLEAIGDDLMVDVCLVPIDERRAMRE